MLLLSTLIFLAVASALAGLVLWFSPTRAEQRLQAMAAPADKGQWTETVVKLAGPLARLSTPDGDWESSPLRIRFLHAGIRHADARLLYFAAKTLLPLLFAGLAFFLFRALNQTNGLTCSSTCWSARWSAATCRTSCCTFSSAGASARSSTTSPMPRT